jgi:hypothetical protein
MLAEARVVWRCGFEMRRVVLQLLTAAAVLVAHFLPAIDFAAAPFTSAQDDPRASCVPTGATCVALNPEVTAETAAGTICTPGYTAGVRPAAGYVKAIKIKLGTGVGLEPGAASAMILDHIIPLCLGGHPSNPSNLQLQDATEAHRKDRLELKLQCLVCSGQVSLAEARAAIATNWEAAYHRFALIKCRRAARGGN